MAHVRRLTGSLLVHEEATADLVKSLLSQTVDRIADDAEARGLKVAWNTLLVSTEEDESWRICEKDPEVHKFVHLEVYGVGEPS